MRSLAKSGDTDAVDAHWSLTNQLLATQVDQLNNLTWSLGGGKGTPPEPIPRPGIPEKARTEAGTGSGRLTEMSLEEAIAFREARRRGETLKRKN